MGRGFESFHDLDADLNIIYFRAMKGETRQEISEIEPHAVRPPNYFAGIYSPAEIEEDNPLTKASVIRAPEDLE
jgi:hypothetical protein